MRYNTLLDYIQYMSARKFGPISARKEKIVTAENTCSIKSKKKSCSVVVRSDSIGNNIGFFQS